MQAAVESALSRVADQPVRVHAAGRTDTGVHASGQVFHIDTTARRSLRSWVLGGNAHLPEAVSLLWATPVPADFHARFSAVGRHYRYVVFNRDSRPALWRGRTAWQCRPLRLEPMQQGAASLVGRHDFSSFRSYACQASSPVRHLRRLTLRRAGPLLVMEAEADGFLHHMVRNLAGVLIAIGQGRAGPDWAAEVLAARDRRKGGVTAPAEGLYLSGVDYPTRYGLPAAAADPASALAGLL